MSEHALYKYSITIHSDDLPMVAAIRGVAWYCQKTYKKGIAWGGTGENEWRMDGHKVTFHFTSPAFRKSFLEHIIRLFPAGWSKTQERDDDPATPQKLT